MGNKAAAMTDVRLESKVQASALLIEGDPKQRSLLEGWEDVRNQLNAKGLAVEAPPGPLGALPPELLGLVLDFLDYQSLLALRQTCLWAYGLLREQDNQARLLADIIRRASAKIRQEVAEAKLTPKQETDASTAEICISNEGDLAQASKATLEYIDSLNMKDLGALRAGLARVLTFQAMRDELHIAPSDKVAMFAKAFDPSLKQERIQAYASIRYFSMPSSIYLLGDDMHAAIARGLAGADMGYLKPKEEVNMWDGDAWTYNNLSFGSELVPITSAKQFEDILQEHKEMAIYGEKMTLSVPKAQVAMNTIAQIVGGQELVLWRDVKVPLQGHGGHRLMVIGGAVGAVVQWEYYSNFCGGPYAAYSCGMG